MSKPNIHHPRALLSLICALLGVTALFLASCGAAGVEYPSASGGSSSGSPGSPGSPAGAATPAASATETPTPHARLTLTCTTTSSVQGIDVINMLLICNVTGAPSADTSFTLDYAITSPSTKQAHQFFPACAGHLTDGSGVCTQRYAAPVPLAVGAGVVTGTTAPDQRPLGPVSPTQISTTPPPSGTPLTEPPSTFVPHA
jgi:hypothetical protein